MNDGRETRWVSERLARWRQNSDRDALGELLKWQRDRAVAVARRVVGRATEYGDADADDVVQQAFCRAIERLDKYRGEAALYTWLFQICRNTLVDYFRYTSRENRHAATLEELPQVRAVLDVLAAPLDADPETGAWRCEVSRFVQATVDVLPERYAQILEWKYIDGRPVRAISEQLGVSEKAAESLLGRAREAFRKAMMEMASDPDVFSPPGRV